MMKFFSQRFRQGGASGPLWQLVAILLLTCTARLSALAQGQTLTGTVKESDGSLLPGATVQVKGTNRGTQTGADGAFQLTNVPASSTVVVSFIGKTTQEILVGNRSSVDVTLADDSQTLQEVTVNVGYGIQRRKDLTGSIASISTEDFQKGNIVTPEQLIAGKLAGVQITPPSGQPGGGSTIRIRGGSSLNASNDPLVVIDGVPVDNSSISGISNPLSVINPQDIETFTVLKDASAAAIYGSRAANGVILITTKKGASGAPRVSFSTLPSIQINPKQVPVLTGDQFREYINSVGTAEQKALLGTENTNWQDQIFRTGWGIDNNLSVAGSFNNLPYRLSVGYNTQNGTLKTSQFERYSAALNLTPRLLNNNLRTDISLKGSIIKNRFADQGAIGAAIAFDPTKPVYSGNANFGGFYEWIQASNGRPNQLAVRNPLGLLINRDDRTTINRFIGNAQLDYKMPFLPELRANLNVGLDASSSEGTNFVPAYAASQFVRGLAVRPTGERDSTQYGGQNNQSSQTRINSTAEFYFNYAKDIAALLGRIDATVGYSYQDFQRNQPAYPNVLANGVEFSPAGVDFKTRYTLVGFFGRLNYNIKDRYVLTATLRRDGTSRFSPEARWGWFPSAGFAWSIKDESFLQNARNLTTLKLRLGYGVTGQQDLTGLASDYAYLPRYTLSDLTAQYQFGNDFVRTLRPEGYDRNLKWEQTEAVNAAIDWALFKGRLSGSVDFYRKRTSDLLAIIPVPAGSNLTNRILTNVGNLENRGVEVQINGTPIQREGLNLDLGFNLTYNQNKITNLTRVPVPNDPGVQVGDISGGVGNQVQIQTVGFPTNTFYLLQQVYGANGQPLEGVYVDQNGDGQININDRVRDKSANPQLFLGFTSQLTYGKLSAGFVLRGNVGNYVYNNVRSGTGTQNNFVNALGFLANGSTNVLDTRFSNSQYFSNYYLENASFVRMDNLNVGYNFGRLLSVGNRAVSARLTLNAQNVFVITKYSGLDPEISGGIDNNFYPRPRIFSAGLNLDF